MNVPIIGNTWALGGVFQFHLIIVAFIMGIAIVGPIAEWTGLRRKDERWDQLARQLSTFIGRVFAFGATFAVFALVLIFGLYPRVFGVLTSIFFWPLVIVGGVWVVMSVSSYAYYQTWDRLRERRGLHITIGAIFAIFAFIFISLIIQLSSYQLTPSQSTDLLSAAFNPSWLPEFLHRQIGNLSYAGLLLAGIAASQIVIFRRDAAYFDWVGHIAVVIGLILAFIQPVAGYFYVTRISGASPGAFQTMMVGSNAGLFLIQLFLFNGVLFLTSLYFTRSIRRGEPRQSTVNLMRNLTIIILVLLLLGLIPKELPLGAMFPWKMISIAGTTILGLANLVLYLRERRNPIWGKVGAGSQWTLIALAVFIVALLVIMGVIRESARGGDYIYQQLGPGQSQQFQR